MEEFQAEDLTGHTEKSGFDLVSGIKVPEGSTNHCKYCHGQLPRPNADEPTCTACNPCTTCKGNVDQGYICPNCFGTAYNPFKGDTGKNGQPVV